MSLEHGRPITWFAPSLRRANGFTLIEVLVVLAILVMLFGLLFTPIMTGMGMFTAGEQQVTRQDTAGLAWRQIAQELAGAYFIVDREAMATLRPTPLEVDTGQYDFSRIAFIPSVPGTTGVPQPSVVEFWVGLGDPALPYSDEPTPANPEPNTFVLYRGQWSGVDVQAAWAKWAGGQPPDVLTSLTPKNQTDIPSNTLFADGTIAEGYWDANPATGSAFVGHQIRGVQFAAQQMVGEQLSLDPLGMQYTAAHGYWEGPQNDAADQRWPAPLSAVIAGAMAPRIIAYRYDPALGSYQPLADTDSDPALRVAPLPDPATCALSYDSYRGRVIAWQYRMAEYPDSDGNAANNLIPVSAYEYNLPGLAGGATKVVRGSAKVYYATPAATPTSWTSLVRSESNADDMQPFEFNLAGTLEDAPWAVTTSHLTFSRVQAPDTTTGRIVVVYHVRNNFFVDAANALNPANGTDDLVRVDYFTRELIGTTVTVAGTAALQRMDAEATPQTQFNEALSERQAGVIKVENMPLSP